MDFYNYNNSQSWTEGGEGEPADPDYKGEAGFNINFDYNSIIEGILQKALEKILDEGPENVIRDILSKKDERILDLENQINNLAIQITALEARIQHLENLLRSFNLDPSYFPYGGISTTGTPLTPPF